MSAVEVLNFLEMLERKARLTLELQCYASKKLDHHMWLGDIEMSVNATRTSSPFGQRLDGDS